jgi:hypothetical protein
MEISAVTMESSMEVPKKLKIELPYDPAVPLLDLDPKEWKSGYNRDTRTAMFVADLVTAVKLCYQPRGPLNDELIKYGIYYIMEYYSSIRKEEIMLFAGK